MLQPGGYGCRAAGFNPAVDAVALYGPAPAGARGRATAAGG